MIPDEGCPKDENRGRKKIVQHKINFGINKKHTGILSSIGVVF